MYTLRTLIWCVWELSWPYTSYKFSLVFASLTMIFQLLGMWTITYHYFTTGVRSEEIMRDGIVNFEAKIKANKMRGIVYWTVCIFISVKFVVAAAI